MRRCLILGMLALILGCSAFATPQAETVKVYAFTAPWCSACQQAKPIITEMRAKGVSVISINTDDQPELAKEHRIKYLPTFIVFKDGVSVKRTTSVRTAQKFVYKLLGIK